MSMFGPKIKITEKLEKWSNLDFSGKIDYLAAQILNNWIFARKLLKK